MKWNNAGSEQERGGGDRGGRTPNLGIANAALSQLSYVPTINRATRRGVAHLQS